MSKPFLLRSSDGFSLVELQVALVVSLFVAGAVLTLALSSKKLFETDEARVRLSQDLRAGRDFLAADILIAGERLGQDFPAIEIVDGGAGLPDTLDLRRNLLDVVLPVCADVVGTSIKVAATISPPAGCAPVPDGDADGWPDNLQAWHDHRLARGGSTMAYIFNPATSEGEFFEYVWDDATLFHVDAAPSTTWDHAYPVTDQCRLYMLEERRYGLENRMLRILVNRDAADPINVIYDVEDFQAAAVFQDGTEQNSLGPTDLWRDLATIGITLQSRTMVRNRPIDRSLSVDVMPRNVLSR